MRDFTRTACWLGLAWAGGTNGLLACSTHHIGGEATLVITKGGTYSGTYRSVASGTACVRIATTEPVVLAGCTLAGPGNLIEAGEGADLTVRNCTGQGLVPTVDKQAPGYFISVYRPQRLVIEHNAFAQTGGIVVDRWHAAGQAGSTLTVRYNRVRNVDGRWRDGQGRTSCSFLILNTVQHLPGVDIAYNEVLNEPDKSLVEDNINLYNSSGTAQSPLHVHDNFVRGAYPFPASADKFTGTGLTSDGDAKTVEDAAAFIEADHNQFVSTGNAAMNLAAGHDIYYHHNRAVTSGLLPGGQRFRAVYAGLGVFNFYHQPTSVYFNNRVADNTVGYANFSGSNPHPNRNDYNLALATTVSG
ncbi:MAG: hypothetical protein EOO36_23325, partial [Cytophagaceae bacterium]